jgi:hypothetical protein
MPRIHQEIPMQPLHPARTCTLLGLAVLILSSPARAQQPALPAEPDATEPPAAQDATPTAAQDATQLPAAQPPSPLAAERFAEGTRLFKQWRFDEAEQKFRVAITHRDHPQIHLYLSRALEKQGRLVEAHEALQPALRPGVEPLPPEDAQMAEDLRKGLQSRLAQIEAHCDIPGAEVYLDGEPWFTAPGRQRRMIGAGQHVLIARKPGYFPVIEPVSLIPGKQTRAVLRMTADVVQLERRWNPWQPRAVAGTGFAVSLAGGLLLWQARTDYATTQREIDACREKPFCDAISIRRRNEGEWKQRIGTGALITGGVVLAAGLAGMFLNLPRSWRSEPARGLENLDIVPMVSGDAAGISARLQF